ncbi:MAG: hypothetical protein IT442_04705 [Phycisphaeraceae bacterium]|nr:hypothetical protein [Phycisphaeraceae bacterium]
MCRGSLLVLGLAVLGLGGCQSWQSKPYPALGDRPTSLVMDKPMMVRLSQSEPAQGDYLPWYAYRNDLGPVAFRGYEAPSQTWVHERTYDRQSTVAGRVRDYRYQTTIRHRVQFETQ